MQVLPEKIRHIDTPFTEVETFYQRSKNNFKFIVRIILPFLTYSHLFELIKSWSGRDADA